MALQDSHNYNTEYDYIICMILLIIADYNYKHLIQLILHITDMYRCMWTFYNLGLSLSRNNKWIHVYTIVYTCFCELMPLRTGVLHMASENEAM